MWPYFRINILKVTYKIQIKLSLKCCGLLHNIVTTQFPSSIIFQKNNIFSDHQDFQTFVFSEGPKKDSS